MDFSKKLNISLICSVAAVSLAIAYYQTRAETRGLEQTLERQALVLADSLARSAEVPLESRDYRGLQRLVDRFRDKEQVAGIGVYTPEGDLVAANSRLSTHLDAEPVPVKRALEDGMPASAFLKFDGQPMHVVALPIRSGPKTLGILALVQDATYIDLQTSALWRRALLGVSIQTILIAGITLLIVRRGFHSPLLRMTSWLRGMRTGVIGGDPPFTGQGGFEPLTEEVTRMASSLVAARAAAEEEARLRVSAESAWTADRLRVFVRGRLSGDRLFAVSNREPYEHFHSSTGIRCSVPASGLVTALEPVLRACDGTWIAQATGNADRESVDESDRVRVPPDHPQYSLRRVWLTKEEEQGFYFGFSNEGLWPLCHIAHTRPTFRTEDWEAYQTVNQKFADALLEELRGHERPVVLLQDYHFALLPLIIKRERPDARVAIFWHIPWPNSEAFGICPWQRELIEGLLGADLIGFHIQAHCNNFLDTVDRALESRVDREKFSVMREGHSTLVRPFPISVAAEPAPPPAEFPSLERAALLQSLGIRAAYMGIGVDRVDYTKGIPERLRGIERFFDKYPAYRRQFTFVQIGSPSRSTIPRYRDLMTEVSEQVEQINRRFETSDWKPIVFLNRQHSHSEILPYYRASDLCMVTSLHDGMNLVAKEYVSSRADEQGTLILSQFTGASHELTDALIVNPYDTEQLADTLHRALEMPPELRRARMQRMRSIVQEQNIYRWAGSLIGKLCEIRTGDSRREETGPRLAPVRRMAANF